MTPTEILQVGSPIFSATGVIFFVKLLLNQKKADDIARHAEIKASLAEVKADLKATAAQEALCRSTVLPAIGERITRVEADEAAKEPRLVRLERKVLNGDYA